MTRTFANARKIRTLTVAGLSVITRSASGRPTVRTFRNRYTLRLFISQVEGGSSVQAGK